MRIDSIRLRNYRCFKDITVSFPEPFTLVIGNNAAGKTTLLDALALGMASYFLGMEGTSSGSIRMDDVRAETYEMGSSLNRSAQYPAEIICTGNHGNDPLCWKRALNGSHNKTTYGDAKEIRDAAKNLSENLNSPNKNVILPILCYYGTGRLWMQKKAKTQAVSKRFNSRTIGYADCLDSASNEKMMYEWFEKMTMQSWQDAVEIPELEIVSNALLECFNGESGHSELGHASDVKYRAKSGELEITYIKADGTKEISPMRSMSAGYRSMLSMVADIAYRMAVLNPQLLASALKQTPGIVLIDEIDLHLHPTWQQRVVGDLRRIFPKVQFIATTHAPSVISSVQNKNLIILDAKNAIMPDSQSYGKDANSVLRRFMDAQERPGYVLRKFESLNESIEGHRFDEAQLRLDALREQIGDDDPEIVAAEYALTMEKMEQ